jgi:hypothetical protein
LKNEAGAEEYLISVGNGYSFDGGTRDVSVLYFIDLRAGVLLTN